MIFPNSRIIISSYFQIETIFDAIAENSSYSERGDTKDTNSSKKKVKVCLYIAQYPVRWTAQSALHFLPSLTDLFIPTPTELGFSGKHSSDAAITCND